MASEGRGWAKVAKQEVQIAATYMGAIIGAGFASGQELLQFFALFGARGMLGILFSGFLFALLGAGIFRVKTKLQAVSYRDMMGQVLGMRVGVLVDVLITIFLFLGISVMLAGSAAVFNEYLGIPTPLGLGLTVGLIIISLGAKEKGLLLFNTLLIPVLVAITLLVVISTVPATDLSNGMMPATGKLIGGHWLVATVLYVSYNMITGLVILSSLESPSLHTGTRGAVLGGMGLGSIGFLMVLSMLGNLKQLQGYQIPMLYLAATGRVGLAGLYSIVLWSAMVTTAATETYGLVKRLTPSIKMGYHVVLVGVLLAAVPLANLGFVQLVSKLYPLFGYLGLLILTGFFGSLARR